MKLGEFINKLQSIQKEVGDNCEVSHFDEWQYVPIKDVNLVHKQYDKDVDGMVFVFDELELCVDDSLFQEDKIIAVQ